VLSAVIFDMDGLLVDSEPLWVRAEIEIFGAVGLTLAEPDCALTKGLRTDDVVAYWHARRPWDASHALDVVERRLIERVAALVADEGVALPGVAHAIAIARENGRAIALASSSPEPVIRATLARLGLENAFAIVQSAHGEPYGKPHPGIFIRTAERLGVAPTDCLVLEDSLAGVIAAKAARMTCIAVPFDHPDHDPRFAIADAILGSLADVDADLLLKLSA
jgi:sugar-phosphatase